MDDSATTFLGCLMFAVLVVAGGLYWAGLVSCDSSCADDERGTLTASLRCVCARPITESR